MSGFSSVYLKVFWKVCLSVINNRESWIWKWKQTDWQSHLWWFGLLNTENQLGGSGAWGVRWKSATVLSSAASINTWRLITHSFSHTNGRVFFTYTLRSYNNIELLSWWLCSYVFIQLSSGLCECFWNVKKPKVLIRLLSPGFSHLSKRASVTWCGCVGKLSMKIKWRNTVNNFLIGVLFCFLVCLKRKKCIIIILILDLSVLPLNDSSTADISWLEVDRNCLFWNTICSMFLNIKANFCIHAATLNCF